MIIRLGDALAETLISTEKIVFCLEKTNFCWVEVVHICAKGGQLLTFLRTIDEDRWCMS